VVPLVGQVQQYAWGKVGSSSAVAQLAVGNSPAFVVKEDEPYAEVGEGRPAEAAAR
jgi:mannose-6-phosphate isomerase